MYPHSLPSSRWLGLVFCFALLGIAPIQAAEIRMPANPSVSPDGTKVTFDWNGDIWVTSTQGGKATRLTSHSSKDREPKFSPDGKTIAFVSDREGGAYQIFVMDAAGGPVRQITHHTAGFNLQGWAHDGKALLATSIRDHAWRHANRFFLVSVLGDPFETLLFDDQGQQGSLSPTGQLLYCREGTQWWRKGYHGSQASQIWLREKDGAQKKLLDPPPLVPGTKISHSQERGALWPQWIGASPSYLYVGAQDGSFNLWEQDLASGANFKVTDFKDDLVLYPSISGDGSTIVFRRLFDFYRIKRTGPGKYSEPTLLKIDITQDQEPVKIEQRSLSVASAVDFSADGLEMVFVAGGDLWVMDTELKEPVALLQSSAEEREPTFAPDGESIVFVGDRNGNTELFQAKKGNPKEFWWRQKNFDISPLTKDGEVKSALSFSPDGTHLAFQRGRGNLVVAKWDPKTGLGAETTVVRSFSKVDYDWSPDGKWFTFAKEDDSFNRDVFVTPIDGSKPPFNISRHPRNDSNPVWSPDGKMIAFLGQRDKEEVDIKFVYLATEDNDKNARERQVEKAMDKMKSRRPLGQPTSKTGATTGSEKGNPGGAIRPSTATTPPKPVVKIDFDRLEQRVKVIANTDVRESQLFWSPDSKKLGFVATGVFTVEFPEELKPKQINSGSGTNPRWLKSGSVVWLLGGSPASFNPTTAPTAAPVTGTATPSGRTPRGAAPAASSAATAAESGGTAYRFAALQTVNNSGKQAEVFDQCWRIMRDNWYDEKLNNRNWNDIRAKYLPLAMSAPDMEAVGQAINMMLGELNGSHLAFSNTGGGPPRRGPAPVEEPAGVAWRAVTPHLGLRFDPSHPGPGLLVKDVINGSPADKSTGKILVGETVVSLDGKTLLKGMDFAKNFNGPQARDMALVVKDLKGVERTVVLRPISFTTARSLLYDKWLLDNEAMVHKLSQGKLGYLHISAMDMPSFHKFEEKLAGAGLGREGLIIDVRENGGGSTADLLLTCLTQPGHAITVPRGGQPGYPHDRLIFPRWDKPITVLCNQNSFSNAEIFSHAIKHLKRGKLVGVPTAGGVISTGGTSIMDVGFLRMPFRGWYLAGDGQDLELNGAVPDYILWPKPEQLTSGKDIQMEKAVEVLLKDVELFLAKPQPKRTKSSERGD